MTPARTAHAWRRRIAALLIFGATLIASGFVYLVGAFSDWSGQHRMPPQTLIGAVVISSRGRSSRSGSCAAAGDLALS